MMGIRPDRRNFVVASAALAGTAGLGPGKLATAPVRGRATYRLVYPDAFPDTWGIDPASFSAFDELPADILDEMVIALLGEEDRAAALTYADLVGPKLKACFQAGFRHGYHFRRSPQGRPIAHLSERMIEAYEPFLCRVYSTPAGIARWLAGCRQQVGKALAAAERHGWYYRDEQAQDGIA